MNHMYPKKSICWFCDDAVFQSSSEHGYELQMLFHQRMHHIAQHLRATENRPIRPDFFLLDHLVDHGLVDESALSVARVYRENPIPLPRDTLPGQAPPKREVVNVVTIVEHKPRGSRRDRSSRSSRERGYHQ